MKHPRKQRHTAVRIYQRLLEEYPDKLQVKERTVRRYVSQKKRELYGQIGYLPLKHPGGEAQADFGEVLVIEKGKRRSSTHSTCLSRSVIPHMFSFLRVQTPNHFLQG